MRVSKSVLTAMAGLLLLAGCGGDAVDDSSELPTQFILPTLTTSLGEVTDEPVASPTAAPTESAAPTRTSVPSVTPGPEATDEAIATGTPGQAVLSGTGEEVIQDFSALEIGSFVFVGGVVVVDDELGLMFLDDGEGNRLFIGTTTAMSGLSDGDFVTMSGQVEGIPGEDTLTLNSGSQTGIDEQQPASLTGEPLPVDLTLEPGLTALQAYDALLSFAETYLDGHQLTVMFGSSFTGWTVEFYRLADGEAYRFTLNSAGQVSVLYFARLDIQPGLEVVPFERAQVGIDSDAVYARLDLTDVPEFLIPELRLYAPQPGQIVWQVFGEQAQEIDATAE